MTASTTHSQPSSPINPFQKAAAENYADGEFAWILQQPDWTTHLDACGDTFFIFLMRELSTKEDCCDPATALSRLQSIADDTERIYDAIDALVHNPHHHRIIATFVPQVWINDRAVTADPLGDTEIDITDAVLALSKEDALNLRDDTYEADALINRDFAPDWINDWSGPFYLAVEAAIAAYFCTLTNPTGAPAAVPSPRAA